MPFVPKSLIRVNSSAASVYSRESLASHQRRSIFPAFKMPAFPRYNYVAPGRRRAPFPPVMRGFQKQPRSFSVVTMLLIAVPFAAAFLFTVDIRSQFVSTIERGASAKGNAAPQQQRLSNMLGGDDTGINDPSDHEVVLDNAPLVEKVQPPTVAASTSSVATTTSTATTSTTATTTTTTTTTAKSKSAGRNADQSAQQLPGTASVPQKNKDDTSTGEIPANGISPPSLPRDHPHSNALEEIRARTQMSPRWPMSPHTLTRELRTYGQAYSSILLSHKLKVVYVPVFKVATTSMMWNIAYLENIPRMMEVARTEPEGELMKELHDMSSPGWLNHTVHDLTKDEISEILDNPEYLKFGFVRNPYDRIVSAYVDKVMRPPVESEEYQDQMYSLFGSDLAIRKKVNETQPTFLEFLEAVKKIMALPRTLPNGYEDSSTRRDMHWRPQVELLHPDLIHLDFVGHFDRMNEDKEVVISWMHRHTDRRLPQGRTARLHSTDPSLKRDLLEKLRSDDELRNLLLNIYNEDFTRFHFSKEVPFPKQLDIAKR